MHIEDVDTELLVSVAEFSREKDIEGGAQWLIAKEIANCPQADFIRYISLACVWVLNLRRQTYWIGRPQGHHMGLV